jgi:HEAT repeat protein
LGEIDDPASYRVLVEALEDDDPEIRKYAARALGR